MGSNKSKDTGPHITSRWALSKVLNEILQLRPNVMPSVCVSDIILLCACACMYSSASNKRHYFLPDDDGSDDSETRLDCCKSNILALPT